MTGSGDFVRDERRAQDMLYNAVTAFRSNLQDAGALTSVRHDEVEALLRAFDDFVHDEVPDRAHWNESIELADAKDRYDRLAFRDAY